MYIILSCSHSPCGKIRSYSTKISNLIKFSQHTHQYTSFCHVSIHSHRSKNSFYLSAVSNLRHHHVMYIILSCFHSLCSINSSHLAGMSNQIKFPLHVHQRISFCHVSTHSVEKQFLKGCNLESDQISLAYILMYVIL